MTVLPGSSYFSSDESFAMIRGYDTTASTLLFVKQCKKLMISPVSRNQKVIVAKSDFEAKHSNVKKQAFQIEDDKIKASSKLMK